MESDAISEETVYMPGDEESKPEFKRPEVLEGTGRIDKISREEKNDKVYYRLTIGNTFYTKFINSEKVDMWMKNFKQGDEVSFTWTGKAIGNKEFRNIQRIEKIKGNTSLASYSKDKTPEEWAELRKRKTDSITLGMALNNATILLASMASSSKDPEKWIKECIGSPLWKEIEQRLYANYVEQRNELIGE